MNSKSKQQEPQAKVYDFPLSHNKNILHKDLNDIFVTKWRREFILAGVINRCSIDLLSSLTTTLEPVFHIADNQIDLIKYFFSLNLDERNEKKANKRIQKNVNSIKNANKYFRVNSQTMLEVFSTCSYIEKQDFVLKLVDLCNRDDVIFMRSCISARLIERRSVQQLSNNILFAVFKNLSYTVVRRISLVCRQWNDVSEMYWRNCCLHFAQVNGKEKVVAKLKKKHAKWVSVYEEVYFPAKFFQSSYSNTPTSLRKAVESVKSLIEQQALEATSPRGSQPSSGGQSDVIENPEDDDYDFSMQENAEGTDQREANAVDEYQNHYSHIDAINQKTHRMQTPKHYSAMAKLAMSITDEAKQKIHKRQRGLDSSSSMQMMRGRGDKEKMKASLKANKYTSEDREAIDVRVRLIQPSNQATFGATHSNTGVAEKKYAHVVIQGVQSLKRVRQLKGHLDSVLCCQFDSRRVVTGSADMTIKLWDVRSGRHFGQLEGHQGGVRCILFDDKYIVSGSWDTTIKIWDVVELKLLHTIILHRGCVSSLATNEKTLISASHDKTICILERHTWKLIRILQGHTAAVSSIWLIPDEQLLSCGPDQVVNVWNLESFRIEKSFKHNDSPLHCVKLCGNLLAAGCANGTVALWDFSGGTLEGLFDAHEGPVNSLCFAGETFFTAGSDHMIKEWDISTCVCIRTFTGHTGPIYSIRASVKRIVSTSADGTARIWDLLSRMQQTGGPFNEFNKNILKAKTMDEHEYKKYVRNKFL